ncbi:unnamed protein product [Adineta ricciae]|uniref:Cadherin domain-containing protein n=3 Tax=Adineta ricciae TaxID=249248 RepID=A0A814G2X4_ADIRI|nr:unnamed protein product [Adineta ricciae]
MISYFIVSIVVISSVNSISTIVIDPNSYLKSDLVLHDFRQQFHRTYPYRCLLRTESKYFALNPSCQLITRTSLKQFCSLNSTLVFELNFSHNTTIYELNIQSNQTNCAKNRLCQFEKSPYRIKLKENEVYKNFLHLKTTSSCHSSNYLLSSTNSKKNFEYFSLNSSTGHLSLLNPLDYEATTTWKLVIQAYDAHHIPFYTYVIIDVDDTNDCPPLLSWNFPLQIIQVINDTDPFHIEISVHESKVDQHDVIIANLIASDLDSPPKFDLQINSSEKLPFTIAGPYGDSTYVLLTSAKLDREYRNNYLINLIVSDSGKPMLTSYYSLRVHILDTNDNSPQFEKEIYYVDIQENNFINTTLIQIFANDSDSDENGRITYEINNDKYNYVWIDNQTGIIRTNIQFDYEEIRNFSFNVTAIDHPNIGQPLKATAMIVVNVIDQNDNIPQFPRSSYEFLINENNPPNSYIGQVTAVDADGSDLVYTFDTPSDRIKSLFSLSPSDGKIFALTSFDREQFDQYMFYVIASDGHHVSSPIKVHIKILDLNDEIPRFLFPNDNNDTLIIDLSYWNVNDYICQIEVLDEDLIQTHTLLLIYHYDQLKNFDYLENYKHMLQFDSVKFFLDQQGRLFFNSSNGTTLNEGVYYLAFKIVDGREFYDEKLLKLIVVKDYEHVQLIMRQYDYLGLHLNNRFSYLQYQNSKSRSTSIIDQSNRFLLLIVFALLILILLGITFIFISLIRRKTLKEKKLLKKQNAISSNSQQQSNSSTINLLKPSTKGNLQVTNCFDYNDSSLLILNKDLLSTTPIINDSCCLLDTINEHDIYDSQKSKSYPSWINHPESHYSERSTDSSTFHSFNHFSLRPPSTLSNELCPPKRQTPTEYSVAVVSSSSNNCPHTPVSSDDGFCGSSDTSDPSIPNGNNHLLTSYRQPYIMIKEGIMNKNPSSTLANGTDTTRRVRFNLQSDDQRTMLPNHYSERTLRHFEQIYMAREHILEKQPTNSTVV